MAAVQDEVAGSDPGASENLWYFPSLAEYATLLEVNGLEVTYGALFDRPTVLEGGASGLRDWVEMFLKGALQRMEVGDRLHFIERLEQRLAPVLFRDGRWVMDYRRLRVIALRVAE